MTAAELITELTESFQHEPYPGDLNIVTNNAPDYDLEALGIRETFKVHTWQSLPDALMIYEQSCLGFLSREGLKYYLPAFMQFAVRDYPGAESIPDNLILNLTLPTEMDIVVSALDVKRYRLDEDMPKIDWNDIHQARLHSVNQDVHSFIERYGQFNLAQSRVIYHFLVFMRDEHGKDYWDNELDIAIQRYWFQFG